MFDATACAIELLKMKSSEEFKKEVAATSAASATVTDPVSIPTLKPPDPASSIASVSPSENTLATLVNVPVSDVLTAVSEEKTPSTTVPSRNGSSANGVEAMDTSLFTPPAPVIVYAKKSSPFDIKPKPPFIQSQTKKADKSEAAQVQFGKPETESSGLPVPIASPSDKAPSTSAMAPNVSASNSNPTPSISLSQGSSTGVTSGTADDDAITICSSSDDEEDVYTDKLSISRDNMGPDNNDPSEDLVIKRNSQYLMQRCASLMQRIQGIMLNTSSKHVARQIKAILEHPGFNNNSRTSSLHGRNSLFQDPVPSAHRLTKQGVAEVQFAVKLQENIIRHQMGRILDPNEDSATDESDTDDDEVVLPDERMVDFGGNSSSEPAPYLPVENNPFIEAVKLEKQYEVRRTSIDYSISECEYSLTKSLALRKHCKARKPLFQLEKPSTSTNVINIPVDATSSVKFYHDSKPATTKRVSEMMTQRRSSLEQDKGKLVNGEVLENDPSPSASSSKSDVAAPPALEASQESSTKMNGNDGNTGRNSFIPTIKTTGQDGVSVLGVEFVNNSDPNQSASRCAAIKRPDKNRKVFQLGGIQNIFRDADRLPTVRCACFGRDELCALCLGRAKRKAEINFTHMSYKDKLAILDETFHKSLSFPDDVSLEVLLATNAVGNNIPPPKPANYIQQLIKRRSQQFPPDLLETGPRPKKPRIYDIKPYVEAPIRSPKKDGRYPDDSCESPRKRPPPRKSQSSFDEREMVEYEGKGLGWPSRERKDSVRRTRNQEFDIDNIVIPYSMAATTRVEQLVYKPIETPRWRELDYSEIFSSIPTLNEESEEMSDTSIQERHALCEVDEKKRFTQSLQKALNATRKTRRLDSTCRSESDHFGLINDENSSSSHPLLSPDKVKDMAALISAHPIGHADGTTTPVTDTSTVITEAMANQALKSLFKVGSRRRTVSTSAKVEEVVVVEDEPVAAVIVDPWPDRQYPLPDEEYDAMVECMQQSYLETEMDFVSLDEDFSQLDEDPPLSPILM